MHLRFEDHEMSFSRFSIDRYYCGPDDPGNQCINMQYCG